MLHIPKPILFKAGALAALALALTACGGESDPPSPTRPHIHGVAAVGAPISGGAVDCKCASGTKAASTTGTDGSFTIELAPDDFPCALSVSGGIAHGAPQAAPLHSVPHASGTANVTPLTDLMVASLVGTAPANWYAGALQGDVANITAARLAAALDKLKANLASLPGKLELPADSHPITTPFKAQKGDAADDLLENYARALKAAGLTQADAVHLSAAGNKLTTVTYTARAFTVPGWTSFPLGLRKLPDGSESLLLDDPTLGRKAVPVRGRDAEGNITAVDGSGGFTSILSLMGNRIGMLSGRDSHFKNTVAPDDRSHAHYVYLSDEFKEVDYRELHGKSFAIYRDSKYVEDAVFGADGKPMGAGGQAVMPQELAQAFGPQGLRDGQGGDATVTRAKAFKYTANGKTTYAMVAVTAMDPDVPEALPAEQGVLLAVSR